MNQLDISFEIARRQAEEGMGRALDRAEREIPSWADLALDYLKRYAQQHHEFPGFFVTMQSETDPNFPKPTNERAWGGIWRKAARLKIVTDTGRTMPHPRRHGCKAIIWKSLLRGET